MISGLKQGWLGLGLGLALLSACAHVVPPKGGPEDKTGPGLVLFGPAQHSTQISTSPHVEFCFDKWIDPKSSGKILLSPPMNKDPKIVLDGPKCLLVQMMDTLDTATTYTFTLSRNIKDFRGNSLRTPFDLTLSTGTVIDSLTWQGRILDNDSSTDKIKGAVTVGLYPLGSERLNLKHLKSIPDSLRDSIQFEKEKPMYQSVPDSDGFFKFHGLKSGHYRILAFRDPSGFSKFRAGSDFSTAEKDLDIDGKNPPIVMALSTVPPKDSDIIAGINPIYNINSSDTIWRLRIDWYIKQKTTPPLVVIPLSDSTDSIKAKQSYTTMDGHSSFYEFDHNQLISDSNYQLLGLAPRITKMRWNPEKDSIPTKMIWSQPANNSDWHDPKSPLELVFSNPWQIPADSTWKLKYEKSLLNITIEHPSPLLIRIVPKEELPSASDLRLWSVNAKDSSQYLNFSTIDPKQTAELTGRIDEPGHWTVTLISKIKSPNRSTTCDGNGNFRFTLLKAGTYYLQAFQDLDGNQEINHGSVNPYRPAEPMMRLAQPLQIHAGIQTLDEAIGPVPGDKK